MRKRLKLFIIAIFLFISTISSAQETAVQPYKEFSPFKMVFLPDTHVTLGDKDDFILYKESLVIFQDIIRQLKTEIKPNFIVLGGNLISNDCGKYLDLPIVLDTLADSKLSYYAIFGDREADVAGNTTKEDFAREFDEFDYENTKQTFWKTEPVKDILLIGLDTSLKGKKSGYINLHQLFWLDSVLKENRDKFTIITMHHPPLISTPQDKDVWKDFTLEKPDLFLELINLYPQVKIILSGHHLSNFTKLKDEKIFISCPSIAAYPNTYKVLEIYPDKVLVDNRKISFKQIIKKAKKLMKESDYAKAYNPKKPKSVLKYQKGDSFSRKNEYYFEGKK